MYGHILITNKMAVASTALAFKEYLALGSTKQPVHKVAKGKVTFPDMSKVVKALTAQSEVMVNIMLKFEAMALASKGNSPVHRYQRWVD